MQLGNAGSTNSFTKSGKTTMIPGTWRAIWIVFLLGAAFVAGLWWWLMPTGFPWHHPRMWSNRAMPTVSLAFCLFAVVSIWLQRPAASGMLAFLPATAVGLAVSLALSFPVSFSRAWLLPLSLGALLGAAAFLALRGLPANRAILLASCSLGLVIGGGFPLTQRGPEASTHPEEIEQAPRRGGERIPLRSRELGDGIRFQPDVGRIRVRHGEVSLVISPMLNFYSRSSDRCWVPFEPLDGRFKPGLAVQAGLLDAHGLTYIYHGLERATVKLRRSQRTLEVDAETILNRSVYSHLNSYTALTVGGHTRLTIEFSAIPGRQFEALPFDYPEGRPIQFGYLDSSGSFRVVKARTGEKGPFEVLGSGKLDRADPFVVHLFDDGHPVLTLTFLDWARQLSTELSPTAGWGVPMNSVEFSRVSHDPRSAVDIDLSLASTSIGRGFDSVGHREGAYRNRIVLEMH
jgi:hypothetical protein